MDECSAGIWLTSRNIGIKPASIIDAFNKGVISSLIIAAVQIEGAVDCDAQGNLVPKPSFRGALIALSKALDELMKDSQWIPNNPNQN